MQFTDTQLDRAGRAFMRATFDDTPEQARNALRRELELVPRLHLDNFEVEDRVFSIPDELDAAQNAVRDLARRYRTLLQENAHLIDKLPPQG